MSHDAKRTQGLRKLRRPETASECMQFFQSIDWMRSSLPELAGVETPLQGLLD